MTSKGSVTLAANAGVGNGPWMQWPGGRAMLLAEADWGGGNVAVQIVGPNGTAIAVPSSTLSANGALLLELPVCQVRAVVTTSTGVYAGLYHIPR